ncbi:hypothetical protein CDG81_04820 [Actinopolyspora erythraea]|uniref:Uncharacterized protein n=1 Tax=Actinopolyspora erythraea TaxID=414996 RepID=A0A099D2D8_9ACTN|nr:hypothetical protein [Actinopolyspora erythraea]ASU77750.1 hypothetical protein CDG81_04820 [Actinopolyspora erythraea]KGI79957.1 hypothetical protein IL38_19800 [Actinopolyspora erythraea]
MGLDSPLPRSLEARATWCHPEEAIRWVFAQQSVRYDVAGLDSTGSPLPGWGKRLGQGIKRAAGSAGGAALEVGVSVASGDWMGGGNEQRNNSVPELPDVTVFGPGPDSEAARLLSQHELARLMGSDKLNLDKLAGDWILTSQRLAVLVPENGSPRDSNTSGMVRGALARVGKNMRKSEGTPERQSEPDNLSSFLEVPVSKISDVAIVDRTPGDAHTSEPRKCFRTTLFDGSGFDFYKPEPAAEQMLEMTRGKS